jgi:hypothetical protein
MRIQTFIFNWPGKKQHAAKLERMFRPHCEVIVINSDDSLRTRYPHWQHIGNDGYFTDQWNAALERFDADVFVHIQGDIWPTKVGKVLSECVRFIKNYGVGIYAPNVDFTAHVYRTQSLRKLQEGVYEVPTTDNSFWAIPSEVIRNTPRVDPRVNRLGWGIDFLVSAVARRSGRKIVRDYRFTAGHLKHTGYDNGQALREWQQLKRAVDPLLSREMESLRHERNSLVPRATSWGDPVSLLLGAVRTRISRGAIILQRRNESGAA